MVFNDDLQQFPKSARPLIEVKTGITKRYRLDESQTTSSLAIVAAKKCIEKISFNGKIDIIIVATSTPDRPIPATAALVASKLGLEGALAFDINSVCSGSCLLIQQAYSFINSGFAKNVLVIAADAYSKILNKNDFSTFPYFGDGAAAALISSEKSKYEIFNGIFHSDGNGFNVVTIKGGGTEMPYDKLVNKNDTYFSMIGREVYNFAIEKAPNVIRELLDKYSLKIGDISQLILHQANINIIKSVSNNLGIEFDKCFHNIENYANMAGASVLFALDEYLSQIKESSKIIVTCSFGGGLTWGANLIKVI